MRPYHWDGGVYALLSAPINPIKCQCNHGRDWSVATKNLEVTGSHGKGRNVFLPSHGHTPIETKMRHGKKVER